MELDRDNIFIGIGYKVMQLSGTVVMQMSSYQYPTVLMHPS